MATPKHKLIHISVPSEDAAIFDWLQAQYNQSFSVRELIRAAALQYGNVDLFMGKASSATPGKRGRKKGSGKKQLLDAQAKRMSDVETKSSDDVPIRTRVEKPASGIHMTPSILDDPYMGNKNVDESPEKTTPKQTSKPTSATLADLQSMMDA